MATKSRCRLCGPPLRLQLSKHKEQYARGDLQYSSGSENCPMGLLCDAQVERPSPPWLIMRCIISFNFR